MTEGVTRVGVADRDSGRGSTFIPTETEEIDRVCTELLQDEEVFVVAGSCSTSRVRSGPGVRPVSWVACLREPTPAIVFLGAGVLLANISWVDVDISVESHTVHTLAEITLALLLFADAARVDPRELRHHAGLPVRLLAIGLPLSFAPSTVPRWPCWRPPTPP